MCSPHPIVFMVFVCSRAGTVETGFSIDHTPPFYLVNTPTLIPPGPDLI